MVLAIGATACGDDAGGGAGAAAERARYSAASEPPRVFAERMAKLLATTTRKRDCVELDAIFERSLVGIPCPADKSLRESMARFEIVGAKPYGTGAVVDYTSGEAKDGAAIVLFAAPDRNWGVSRFGVITEPSTPSDDEKSRAGFRAALEDYLAAIRGRDCQAFMKATFTGDKSAGEVCATTFRATDDLRSRLRADPGAAPRYEGGNARYGFFTIETAKPEPLNTTISAIKTTGKSPSPYVILDTAPSPTAEQQRLAIEGLERSRRDTAPETSPSRKADDS